MKVTLTIETLEVKVEGTRGDLALLEVAAHRAGSNNALTNSQQNALAIFAQKLRGAGIASR